MPFASLARIAASIAAALLLAAQVLAQPSGAVDCGNGHYCPAGNACLVGGMCAREVNEAPGSIRTSTGTWCDPGFRETKYPPGKCMPDSYTECTNGSICAEGTTCKPDGTCAGGPPATGPMCGSNRCAAGRICASTGRCMNTQYFHDCGNGTVCSRSAACEHPKGCVFVAPERTPQVRNLR